MTTTTSELVDPAPVGSDPGRAGDDGTRRRIQAGRRFALRVAAVAGLVLVWWAVTALAIWPELIVPRPASVWQRFVESVTTDGQRRGLEGHYLWEHLAASGKRLALGVGAAIAIGVPIGLAMATIRPIRTATEPFLNFVRSIPPLAYFSLLIIWFGIEDTSKVWLLFVAAVAPIALSVVAGAESIRAEWFDAARSQGASRLQVVRHLVVPAVKPELFTGIRLATGFAFTTIVAAETVNGIPGIGGLAWSTKKFNQTDIAVLCVIVIGLCAVAIDQIIRAIERRAVPWKGRA
jgi:taurine transport system permease protein